jgi:glutathione S-transferase
LRRRRREEPLGDRDEGVAARDPVAAREAAATLIGAMPALYYANEVVPIDARWRNAAAYLERLKARPSVARVLREAEPYFVTFPR